MENEKISDKDCFSVSSESIETLKKVNKLHDSYFEKLNEYKILKKHSPDHPDCEKLSEECTRIADESRELLTQL